MYSCGVLTISDKGSRGEREDTCGPALIEHLKKNNFALGAYELVPDSIEEIRAALTRWTDSLRIDFIVTTGGTGLSPRDVTPEATKEILEREIPGIAEYMRATGSRSTIRAILSRGLAGTRKESLIINLPGSKKGAFESLEAVLDAISHAIDKIKGEKADCGS